MRCLLPLILPLACAPIAAPDASSGLAWPAPVTTLTTRLLADPSLETALVLDPALPEGLAAAESAGLGEWTEVAGEPRMRRDDLAPGHSPGANRRSLAFFLHQTDAQLADTESPIRMVGTDGVGSTESACRPQEIYAIHALDALIRTANALSIDAPIDFALTTGDNIDNAQTNELGWFVSVWDGTPLRPDSGDPDSQADEDGNDPIAEFTPVGADFPWYAVAGNHDVLVQGNFDPSRYADDALGTDAPLGTRDLTQPGGPLGFSSVADPSRAVMARSDLASIYLDSPSTPGPVGHGFGATNIADDSVTWAAEPVAGVPIVLLSVDANPPDLGDAELSAAERDTFLVPALDAAQAAGQLVILTSHYALADLAVEGGTRLGDLLLTYPNVVLTVSGHSHVNDIRAVGTPDNPGGFWEIRTASSTDWPGQGRLVELVDNGDGTLSIFTTSLDYLAPPGSMAARARTLSLIDLQGGWRSHDGSGDAEDRNTELLQVLPIGWATLAGRAGVRSEGLP
ncbi:MAG: hypothetical protein Q8P18_05540 [Pseudomonadota bacterium]|nr:hypothetical protein [Pseudomonadota bacterium]